MLDPGEYIRSGVLELYVLGLTSAEQSEEILVLAKQHPAIQREIETIEDDIKNYGSSQRISPTVKAFLMATIDYMERIKSGEVPSSPPPLDQKSKIEDYHEWLLKPVMKLPLDPDDLFAKIIGYTPKLITAIVWIKREAEEEVHKAEHEKFLIVEGTCDITIGEKVHSLKPGDYMEIPLHADHNVKVTSDIPCKVILQRAAA